MTSDAERQPPKTGEKYGARIADLIQQNVLDGGLAIGHFLGSEPELMERFGVSRSTLREGIRQLEAHGLVRMRRGSGGGLIVSGGPEVVAARALTTYLELIDAGLDELLEARRVLEVNAAGLAAERASDADLHDLRALLDRLSVAEPEPGNVRLHVDVRDRIAESSGNPALALFIGALNRFTVEGLAERLSPASVARSFRAAVGPKRKIVEAIVAGDRAEAERATREDLDVRFALIREAHQGEFLSPRGDGPARTGFEPKLGEAIAIRIAHAIARGELNEGQRLGAEPELLARYSVSRAVFREAVRILELHGFVKTRRGFGGGLAVARPDPSYCVGTAVGYLRHSRMDRDHLDEVRRMIAIAVAQLAAERTDCGGDTALERIYRTQLATTGSSKVEAALAFHLCLGELSGNPALALMLRVLLALNWTSPPNPLKSPEMAAELDASHGALLEAVKLRDTALARRRMTEHINRAGAWMTLQLPTPDAGRG